MDASTRRHVLESAEFKQLVSRRWRVSAIASACLFLLYYGYILLVGTNKALLSRRISGAMTLGIPLGAAVIVGAWILTAAYVVWANRSYDADVERLRGHLNR